MRDLSAPDFVSNQGWTCALEEGAGRSSRWHYLNSGRYLVTAGMPRGGRPEENLRQLEEWSLQRGQSPIIFGCETADLPHLAEWQVREIGRQPLFAAGPVFEPTLRGPEQPDKHREMRRQARRALKKDVFLEEVSAAEFWECQSRGCLDDLFEARWQRQPLAEFSFLVELHLAHGQAHRRYFLLRAGEIEKPIGLGILVAGRRGWLLEHQLLLNSAPNGSGELLLCSLLKTHLEEGEFLSLGITPLFRGLVEDRSQSEYPSILGFLPTSVCTALLAAWEPLYGFRRLLDYREKLEPDAWETVYWAHRRGSPAAILWAVLEVFARGSLPRFALASIAKIFVKLALKIPGRVLRRLNAFFSWSLCLWIPILWNLDGELIFGYAQAPKIWAVYDVLLAVGFFAHRWELDTISRQHRWIGPVLFGMVLADSSLSLIQTLIVHQGWPTHPFLGVFLLGLNAAPLVAAFFLLICLGRRGPRFLSTWREYAKN